jgi:hypothetical protein
LAAIVGQDRYAETGAAEIAAAATKPVEVKARLSIYFLVHARFRESSVVADRRWQKRAPRLGRASLLCKVQPDTAFDVDAVDDRVYVPGRLAVKSKERLVAGREPPCSIAFRETSLTVEPLHARLDRAARVDCVGDMEHVAPHAVR